MKFIIFDKYIQWEIFRFTVDTLPRFMVAEQHLLSIKNKYT